MSKTILLQLETTENPSFSTVNLLKKKQKIEEKIFRNFFDEGLRQVA